MLKPIRKGWSDRCGQPSGLARSFGWEVAQDGRPFTCPVWVESPTM